MGDKGLLIIFACFFGILSCDNVGWTRVFDDNPTEFHDIPLTWEFGDYTNVPDWLSGIFVRNGPAQVLCNIYVKKIDSKSKWMLLLIFIQIRISFVTDYIRFGKKTFK